MSELRIYAAHSSENCEIFTDGNAIAGQLDAVGVLFERWQTEAPLPDNADADTVLAAYQNQVEKLKAKYGFQSADVVSLYPEHPDKGVLRQKFLDEHTHSDYEVRFFVEGQGLFNIHKDDKVYAVLCEQGDLISVPANTTHWFDMGPNPRFKCIRFFTTPEGWVANFTGNEIAKQFPRLEN